MAGPTAREETARLLVSCPDRHGIVATISTLLFEAGANIVASDQYSTDPEGGTFFLRMEFHLERLGGRRRGAARGRAGGAGGRVGGDRRALRDGLAARLRERAEADRAARLPRRPLPA